LKTNIYVAGSRNSIQLPLRRTLVRSGQLWAISCEPWAVSFQHVP